MICVCYFNLAPELKNYFVCAGLNSIGIISGGNDAEITSFFFFLCLRVIY